MEVLLVGTIHLGYTPDINALSKDDTDKYSDIHFEQLTNDIAKFQADQIFIEYPVDLQHNLNTLYHSELVSEDFKQNEIYQIGFRLAKKHGHETIYAADWNENSDESLDLKLVAEGKSKEAYEKIMARIPIVINKLSSIIQEREIIKLYKYINSDEYVLNDHKVYVDLMQLEDEIAFEWVSKYWYYRNLRIVHNVKKSIKPETKRIVILYGAAHNYLIKQQLEDDPSIKVIPYGNDLWRELNG